MLLRRRCWLVVVLGWSLLLGPWPAAAQTPPPAASLVSPAAGKSLGGRVIGLSPDGSAIAILSRDYTKLCVLAAATLAPRVCADLAAHQIEPKSEFIAWSPDGTRLALAEDAFATLRDGDLWVLDARTGTLTDRTPDALHGKHFVGRRAGKQTNAVDVTPAWSPDGKMIAFSRSTFVAGASRGTALAVIPAAGGPVKTVLQLTPSAPGVLYYGLVWAPDGQTLYYSYIATSTSDPRSGIYAVGRDGTRQHKLLGPSATLGRPAIVQVTATGTTGLVLYPEALESFSVRSPVYATLDLRTGRATPLTPPAGLPKFSAVKRAIFSPDGRALLLGVDTFQDLRPLYVRELATGRDQQVASLPAVPVFDLIHGLDWGRDGTVLVATGIDTALLLHLPTVPPPAATPITDGTKRRGVRSPSSWRAPADIMLPGGTIRAGHRRTAPDIAHEFGWTALARSPDGR